MCEHLPSKKPEITGLSGAAFGVGRMFSWPAPFWPDTANILKGDNRGEKRWLYHTAIRSL